MTISSNACKKCSKCCKNFPCVELSKEEIKKLEEKTGFSFEKFTNPKGKVPVEEYFLQFKENGDCIFLKLSGEDHFCSVYGVRPKVCQSYPLKPKQKAFCEENMK